MITDDTDKQNAHDQNNIGQKWTFTRVHMRLEKKKLGLLKQKRRTQWFADSNKAI
jgi:hypothetical protein